MQCVHRILTQREIVAQSTLKKFSRPSKYLIEPPSSAVERPKKKQKVIAANSVGIENDLPIANPSNATTPSYKCSWCKRVDSDHNIKNCKDKKLFGIEIQVIDDLEMVRYSCCYVSNVSRKFVCTRVRIN